MMKKKVLIATTVLSIALAGVVSAASIWGTYNGNDIIRITVDGVPVKVTDVPAINYNNRTMIPIYLLKEAGIEYSWDQQNKTVNIISQKKATTVTSDITPTGKKPLTAKEIAKLSDRVGYVESYDANMNMLGSGSGFQLNNGVFITNYHVANGDGSARILVKLDNQIYDNKNWYLFSNKQTDLFGVLLSTSYDSNGKQTGTVPSKGFNYVTTLPEVGDKIYAIGSPQGLENTVSEGIVSGIRTTNGIQLIQHTADTDHGSSGGVLLNEYGEVIGVTSSGFDGTNLDFAIPMKYVQDELDKF